MNLRFVGILVCAGVMACASVPPPQAVLEYARQNCASQPDLATAQSLTPDRKKAVHSVSTQVNGQTPCVTTTGGAASPYVLYVLPSDHDGKTITVGASLEVVRIFAPHVAVLDAHGAVTRTFASDQFMYRGPVYSVLFRPRAAEAYIIVTAEPSLVGQRYDSINISTATSSTYAAGATISWTTGVDATQSRVFSYEGAVIVTVHDTTTEER